MTPLRPGAESPQNGLLLEADQLPRHGNWDATQEFSDLKGSVVRHIEGDKSALHKQKAQRQEAKAKAEAKSMAVSVRVGKIAYNHILEARFFGGLRTKTSPPICTNKST